MNAEQQVQVLAAFEALGPERVRKGLRAFPFRAWGEGGRTHVAECFIGYAFGEGKPGDFRQASCEGFGNEVHLLSPIYERGGESAEMLHQMALAWLAGVEAPPEERSVGYNETTQGRMA